MQNRWRDIFIVWGFSLFCITQMAQGQFYNGLQMSFGKNRIQYARGDLLESDFFYSFYRFDRYDVYFYPNGQKLAEYVSKRAAVELQRLENFFEYSLNKRVIFLVFNKLNDFRQSNIGLVTGKEETNIGGVTKIIDNKVFVYFEGDYRKFDQQITAAITGVILQEMLYGGNVRQRVTSSTLLNLPEWYYKGLLAYVSKGWDVETDDFVRDGILSGKYKKFNQLTGEDAVYAGQSIWNFISETFGSSVISAIVYFTKVNRNVSAGFMNVLGLSLNALSYEWEHYYRTRYEGDAYQGEMPDGQEVKLKNRKNLKYIRTSISPDGRYIAYVSNQIGRIKVYLYDSSAGKSRVIYRTGAKLGQIEDYSYPVLVWHPTGALLAMISEYKGKIRFSRYPLETHKWVHDDLKLFEKVLGFSFADDGINIVVSAVVKGQSDLFIHNLAAHTTERLTDDRADDLSPRFADHSRNILFTSNRKFTNLDAQKASNETEDTYDLFLMHYSTHDPNLIRVAADPLSDHWK
ncbi:MAG: PD40 domain-containing protein, partial [Bacteroidales bacterium]|nr:PD40 domain-containing protein [Bacteroidales bacterium]